MEISRHLLTENHTDKKDTEKMHNEFTEENPADIDFTQSRRKKTDSRCIVCSGCLSGVPALRGYCFGVSFIFLIYTIL